MATVTSAELYRRQGYTDKALAIYEQLLARAPHDRALRETVEELRHEVAAHQASPTEVAVSREVRIEVYRDLLDRLAEQRRHRQERPSRRSKP